MAEQELPGRGKRAARALVGARDAEMSRQQIAVRANGILRELKEAYVDLALARETSGIYQRQVPLLEDLAEAATLRYEAARSGQQDTLGALAELTRLEMQRIAADERATLAEARLNSLLGRPPSRPVGPLAPVTSSVAVDDVEAVVLDRHPDVVMAAAAVAREEAELARLRNERRPDFVVGGGYMLMPGEAGAWTARGGITWPNAPWSRGRLDAAVDGQVKRVVAAEARAASLRSVIRRGVREAVVRLAAVQRRVRLIESTVLPQIEHVFEVARVSYAGGEGGLADVLEPRRALLGAEIELADARADAARARADLESAVGIQ
jgi:cobalt-zinc-cadmium efflux system outer membrane protein